MRETRHVGAALPRPSIGGGTALMLLVLLLLLPGGVARSQTELGAQRVGTSSGTFLKIAVDARSAALGNAVASIIQGPSAVFTNPAGLLAPGTREGTALHLSYVQWPADLAITGAALSSRFAPLDGRIGFGFLYLGTSFEETDEFHPQGTGRTVEYSDLVASVSFARLITDRLGAGLTVKYFREEMGWNLGGPMIQNWLLDAGTRYTIGFRGAVLAIALTNFGPDLRPEGSYESRAGYGEVRYTAFSPPTRFQLGLSLDPWHSGPHRLTAAGQILHQADGQESIRTGLEYWLRDRYALRGGFDSSTEEMRFSAGLGFQLNLGGRVGTVDYAFTEGGHLASVHRWSVGFGI